MNSNRRRFLTIAGSVPFAALAAAPAFAAACYDPATLPASQKSRRRALGYVDVSNKPGKACGGCAFFTATAKDCGTCTMLTGGVVAAAGVCNSYAPKKK